MDVVVLRPMQKEGQHPKLGEACTKLGIREKDVVLDKDGFVTDTNGLSVATRFRGILRLPSFLHPFIPHLLPATLRSSKVKTSLFRFGEDDSSNFKLAEGISEELKVMPKPQLETGYIAPSKKMRFDEFHSAIQRTKSEWHFLSWDMAKDAINELSDY